MWKISAEEKSEEKTVEIRELLLLVLLLLLQQPPKRLMLKEWTRADPLMKEAWLHYLRG